MDKARWARLREIFDHLADKSPSHRKDYLEMVCDDDPKLLAEAETLLAAHDRTETLAPLVRQSTFREPEQIGEYRIDGTLGRGGFGTVYDANHPSHGPVALKVVPAMMVASTVARRRFEREAEVLKRISHPALCRIYDWFVDERQAVLAMERIDGQELNALIRTGALPRAEALRVITCLTEVLQLAHAQSIVHRDLKPSNVLIDSAGTVRLIDFGIAKFADEKLTATGTVMGTPSYMAPEQWRGQAMDQRSDLWALGCLLYELVSGELAFRGEDMAAISVAVLNQEPRPLPQASVDGQPLTEVGEVVARLLTKAPDARYGSCAALLNDLRRLADSESI